MFLYKFGLIDVLQDVSIFWDKFGLIDVLQDVSRCFCMSLV